MQFQTQIVGSGQGSRLLPHNRHGDGSGTRVVMVAGCRGDELLGVHTLGQFHQRLLRASASDPRAVRGTVDIYPVTSPQLLDGVMALPSRSPSGTALIGPGVEQLITDARGARLAVQVYIEDPHLVALPQVHLLSARAGELLPLAAAANADLVCLRRAFAPGSMSERLEAAGVPTLEFHVGGGLSRPQAEQIAAGLWSVCRTIGALGERSSAGIEPPRPTVVEESSWMHLRAEETGVFVPEEMPIWSDRWAGDLLGTVRDLRDGSVLRQVRAPDHGCVLALRAPSLVSPGALLARMAMCSEA